MQKQIPLPLLDSLKNHAGVLLHPALALRRLFRSIQRMSYAKGIYGICKSYRDSCVFGHRSFRGSGSTFGIRTVFVILPSELFFG